MGGSGSGSWCRFGSKATTESQHRVDIRRLKRQGYLQAGISGKLSWTPGDGSINYRMEADRMTLSYWLSINGGRREYVEHSILFDKTLCNYGGFRKWFLCPSCSKRVAILYGAGKYFLCRHCYNLTYTSQQQSREYRLIRKTEKILARLGAPNNKFDLYPPKPKNMQWKTYWRLRNEAELTYNLAILTAEKRFGGDL